MAGKTPAYVEALAVKDGNIVFAGSKDEALKLKDGSMAIKDIKVMETFKAGQSIYRAN
jgi:predicted amidohydrolase YtcJ